MEMASAKAPRRVSNAKLKVVTAQGLRPVKGFDLKGHLSVWVSGNWRMTFTFDGVNAVLVEHQDYH